MNQYTGWQWLLIDAATQFGLDKLLFEERIQWAEQHLNALESLLDQAENKPLYHKAVLAIRRAQAGQPTGHLVGVDATCSGIQIMSVLTGCEVGARHTGLIDPTVRADAYSTCTTFMNEELALQGLSVEVPRNDSKIALMTSFYGSKAQPKRIFGEETPELDAFYAAAKKTAPGAWELLEDLRASWRSGALVHSWKLPDGFDARVKVMTKVGSDDSRSRIEVDELDHATFTYEYFINEGQKKGLSNIANVVHSMDAYVLRCMHRRCNYDAELVTCAEMLIESELISRAADFADTSISVDEDTYNKVQYYIAQYQRSTLADVVILSYLTSATVKLLDSVHLHKLMTICRGMLAYKPFPIITVHDEFKCHPNHVDHMRWQYREILAEIAESTVLDDLLTQLYGQPGQFVKLSQDLGTKIRQSAYALC